MKKRRLPILILTWLLILSALSGCGLTKAESNESALADARRKTITIGYLPITHALAVLEEKRLLDADPDADITIELQKFSSWPDLMDALNSGRIDGASVLAELAMASKAKGIDLKAVALGHHDGNVIVVSNAIQSAEETRGKTLAIPSNQSSHSILIRDMLDKAGLSVDDITIVQLSPAEMPSSLASGAIDGYCVAEPFGARAVVTGYGHVLYESTELWEDSICCAVVFNGNYLKSNTDTVNEFIAKYYEAGNALDTETAKTIAEQYLGQDETTLDASLQWIHFDQLEITEDEYNVLVEKVKKYGILDFPPTYSDFVYGGE